jgi:hypothetical protein
MHEWQEDVELRSISLRCWTYRRDLMTGAVIIIAVPPHAGFVTDQWLVKS